MESAYRAWLKERGEGSASSELNELCRELQTALGIAKWQVFTPNEYMLSQNS